MKEKEAIQILGFVNQVYGHDFVHADDHIQESTKKWIF